MVFSVFFTPNSRQPVRLFLSVQLTFYPQCLMNTGFHKSKQKEIYPLDFLFDM